jgi:hypothetical protein
VNEPNNHRLASNDPGSNAYADVGVAAAVGGETFNSGCCTLRDPFREIEDERALPLPGAPPELGRTLSETVLRSWLIK